MNSSGPRCLASLSASRDVELIQKNAESDDDKQQVDLEGDAQTKAGLPVGGSQIGHGAGIKISVAA